MREVFIVSAVRTPVGKRKGYLREWKAPELLGRVLDEAVLRIDLDPASIDDVINGTVYQIGEQGFTLARMAVLASSFPDEVPGMSVNRQCGSSLTALQIGTAMIASGMMDTVIASGCEIMTKYPIQSDMDGTLSNGSPMGNPWGPFYLRRVKNRPMSQMQVAQAIAEKWGVTREECEAFAASSHAKAHSATEKGYFKNEVMPFDGLDADGKPVTQTVDETIRPDTTAEKARRTQARGWNAVDHGWDIEPRDRRRLGRGSHERGPGEGTEPQSHGPRGGMRRCGFRPHAHAHGTHSGYTEGPERGRAVHAGHGPF